MWKKMLLVACLFGGLALPALAQDKPDDRAEPQSRLPVFVLTLDGKLTYHDGSGPQIPEWDPWIGHGLETGGSWFGLDFREHKELLKQAEKLSGKKVRVTGRLEKQTLGGLIPHQIDVLVVTGLVPLTRADDAFVKKTVRVEMKGQFLFRADHADILIPDCRLTVEGKTYVVDLGADRDLLHAAAALDGHTAIVMGTLDGDTLKASAIKGDGDFVRKKVSVEVKGLLERHGGLRCLSPEFSVTAGKDYFGLEFADPELRKSAVQFSGKTVVLTGTLEENTERGDIIRVASLKADDGAAVQEATASTLKGKLQYVITQWDTGEVLFTCDKLPEPFAKCWSIGHGVTVDGKLYRLHFGNDKDLREQAEKLVGQPVVAFGSLKQEVLTVASLKRAK
jgi:hypothetical protein